MSDASGRNHFDRRDEELKQKDKELGRLRRLVRDLELEERGRCWRRDHEERREGSTSVGDHPGARSHKSESHQHRDCSWEYADRDLIFLEKRRPRNAAMDTINHSLCRVA